LRRASDLVSYAVVPTHALETSAFPKLTLLNHTAAPAVLPALRRTCSPW